MMFLEEQGYSVNENTVFQDNKNVILVKTNVINSCNGNSLHVNIIYLFIKDSICKGEVKVKYCLKDLMLEDYFTKTLMGESLRDLRNLVMRYKSIFGLDPSILHSFKEHVGKPSKREEVKNV